MRPPTRVAPSGHRTTATPEPMGRQTKKAVLAQCDNCSGTCTAIVTPTGRILGLRMSADFDRGSWFHRGCGGRFVAFDLEVTA